MRTRIRRTAALAVALGCGALTLPAGAGATGISVTTTSDISIEDDLCSLREAITAATTNSPVGPGGADDDCPAGEAEPNTDIIGLGANQTYTIAGTGDDDNTAGDFDLTSGAPENSAGHLIISGATGAGEVPLTTIDAQGLDRIFDVRPGGTPSVYIEEVVLRNGNVPGGSADGGAIRIEDDDAEFSLFRVRVEDSDAGRYGGGLSVDNAGVGVSINLDKTEFSGNTAGDEGGGLYVDVPQDDQVSVSRSALIGNSAGDMGGGAYVESGGVPGTDPVLTFLNSTLSGNTAGTGGGAIGFDFGLQGTVWLRFSTVANNSTQAAGAGGGIFTDNADQFVLFQGGVIVSGNTAAGVTSNCAGPGDFQSLGYNIEATDSCGLDQGTDLVNTNPLLAPLAYNAGNVLVSRTHGLYDESPAVDQIPFADCNAGGSDQRGVPRLINSGSACDAGAYEGTVGPKPADPPANPGDPPATTKKCKAKKKKKKKKRSAGASKKKKKKKKKCKKKKKKKKKK